MKNLFMMFIISILALAVFVSCEEGQQTNNTPKTKENIPVEEKTDPKTKENTPVEEKTDMNDFVTIKEAVNKEALSPNGDMVQYIYEVPVINIDKPGAQAINDRFLNVVKDLEKRISDGQLMPGIVKSKAFLNHGMISVVMDINKTGPGGIYAANYDIDIDKEISTKELLETYNFDPQKLIAEIDRQVQIDKGKPLEERRNFIGIDYFVDTIITNESDEFNKLEEMLNQTKAEKERFVIINIDKLAAYVNGEGKIVFIHRGALADEELVVQ